MIFIKYCKRCERAFDVGEGDTCYDCLREQYIEAKGGDEKDEQKNSTLGNDRNF